MNNFLIKIIHTQQEEIFLIDKYNFWQLQTMILILILMVYKYIFQGHTNKLSGLLS